MQILKAALLYFALVFGIGFVLGTVRTLWLVPRVGVRAAELVEMPVMLLVIVMAAQLVVQVHSVPGTVARLAVGCIGLALMLAAEFGFVLWLRGISVRQYLATRDPVAGTIYYAMLVVFALMPLWVGNSNKI
jgi:type IV secretory pathway TrbD component